jgi:hypothetical protein
MRFPPTTLCQLTPLARLRNVVSREFGTYCKDEIAESRPYPPPVAEVSSQGTMGSEILKFVADSRGSASRAMCWPSLLRADVVVTLCEVMARDFCVLDSRANCCGSSPSIRTTSLVPRGSRTQGGHKNGFVRYVGLPPTRSHDPQTDASHLCQGMSREIVVPCM